MPFNIGPFELLLVLILALLILGPGKLPEVGSALGRTIREFRKASTEVEDSLKVDTSAKPAPAVAQTAPASPVAAVTPSAATTTEPEVTEDRAAS
jgi:sec-independent protein translocase protein TatA